MVRRAAALLLLCFALAQVACAQSGANSAAGPSAAQSFDVKAAVDAYLNSVPPDARARSNAYFEGGYWLLLWDFLFGSAVSLLLLFSGLSSHMRNLSERITRVRWVQPLLYWVQYLVVTSILGFPLTLYEGYFREHKYGLLNQTFGPWFGEQMIGLALGAMLGGLAVTGAFAIVRALPRTWWIWGSVGAVVYTVFIIMIGPVFIAPLFNKYTKLDDARVRDPILSMARANGIPAQDVWKVDASRQSNRVSANVSGFLGTERITLNDNLLNRCTLPEIETVMGHEMGHYVLNHVFKDILFIAIEALVFFAFLRWALDRALARWGERWGIRGISDPAVLPLVVLIGAIFFFVLTPVNNSWTRTQEYEADIFGLNAAGQPDGEAKVDLMLGEYRKLDPTPLEEVIFFDHPSGRTRITAAMRWKAEHLSAIAPVRSGATAK
jgi:STE24 endopeptidase